MADGRPTVVSEPVRSPVDGTVRGWVRQHIERAEFTDFGIVLDFSCFLSPSEAREVARALEGVADEYEGRLSHERKRAEDAARNQTFAPPREDASGETYEELGPDEPEAT